MWNFVWALLIATSKNIIIVLHIYCLNTTALVYKNHLCNESSINIFYYNFRTDTGKIGINTHKNTNDRSYWLYWWYTPQMLV